MLIIFGIGIFGSSLSTVECRFHMTTIMQLGFLYFTIELFGYRCNRDGVGARKRDLQTPPGLERMMAAIAPYVRCSSRAVSSLGMSSVTSCPHASFSSHQRRSLALA